MLQRCLNTKHAWFRRYGGRGIVVCDRWRESFENFNSDMGPSNGLTLDRIDNDGNYSPENCRWATQSYQASNRGQNKFYHYKGKRVTLQEIADMCGVRLTTVWKKLNWDGLTTEEVVMGESLRRRRSRMALRKRKLAQKRLGQRKRVRGPNKSIKERSFQEWMEIFKSEQPMPVEDKNAPVDTATA